jgi:hypothetical protein
MYESTGSGRVTELYKSLELDDGILNFIYLYSHLTVLYLLLLVVEGRSFEVP